MSTGQMPTELGNPTFASIQIDSNMVQGNKTNITNSDADNVDRHFTDRAWLRNKRSNPDAVKEFHQWYAKIEI
jgi:hypothetical protein